MEWHDHVDGGGDVCVQVQVDDGGDDAVPVDDSGGTALIKADGGIDVKDLIAEGGDVHTQVHPEGAVQVLVTVDYRCCTNL